MWVWVSGGQVRVRVTDDPSLACCHLHRWGVDRKTPGCLERDEFIRLVASSLAGRPPNRAGLELSHLSATETEEREREAAAETLKLVGASESDVEAQFEAFLTAERALASAPLPAASTRPRTSKAGDPDAAGASGATPGHVKIRTTLGRMLQAHLDWQSEDATYLASTIKLRDAAIEQQDLLRAMAEETARFKV